MANVSYQKYLPMIAAILEIVNSKMAYKLIP